MGSNRGISALGMCHREYDMSKLQRSFAEVNVIRFGYLDKFFNANSIRRVANILKMPKPKFCRPHIINGPGMNNGRTQPHEITYRQTTESLQRKILAGDRDFMGKFKARLLETKKITDQAIGPLELAISPWLEHEPIQKKTFDILAAEVRAVFGPSVPIVDNPVRGDCFPGYLREKHGANPDPNKVDIVDLDGLDFEGVDIVEYAKRYQHIKACFIWGYRDNGMEKGEAWKPPAKREHFTTSREFKVYRRWVAENALEPRSRLMTQDVAGTNPQNPNDGAKRDFVWKLGDDRNFAVALFPRRYNRQFKHVSVRKNGEAVDTGRFRGLYTEDGSNRLIYDFRKHPCEIPDNSVIHADGDSWVLRLPSFRID